LIPTFFLQESAMPTSITTTPATMPRVQIHGVDSVAIDEVSVAPIGDDDVRVRVRYCGICGSDLGFISQGGMFGPGHRMALGHEFSGVVDTVGRHVTRFKPGQNVVVNPMNNMALIGNGGPEGGFSPYVAVRNVTHDLQGMLPLPDAISLEHAALIEPLAVGLHAVHQARVAQTDRIVVMGAGPIGLCITLMLKHQGCGKIIVVDRSAHRLAIAQQLGADAVCLAGRDNLNEIIAAVHGTDSLMGSHVAGSDVYFEVTGVEQVFHDIVAMAKTAARVVIVSAHKKPVKFDLVQLMFKELHMIGSLAYPTEFPTVISLLANNELNVAPLISHHFPLRDFATALQTAKNAEQSVKVLIDLADAG